MKKYFEWGEWPELLLYKCFWLNTDAKVHKLLDIKPNEILDLKGHYLWEQEVFNKGKSEFVKNFKNPNWFSSFSKLADELTEEMLRLENSDNLEVVFKQASECLSCSEVINLFDHALVEYIDSNYPDKKQDIFDSIHPKAKTYIMQLQEDIRNNKSEDYLLEKYAWVGTHGFDGEPFSRDKIEDFRTGDSFSVAESDSEIAKIGSDLSFYRSYIVETVDKVLFSIIPALNKFAHNNSIKIEDVYYLTPHEVLNYSGLPDDFEMRKQYYGVIGTDEGFQVLTGDDLDKKTEDILFNDYDDVDEVKGTVAYKGLVTGSVKVITDKNQISDVQDGDIIISNETTPEYVSAMKKSGAIVTNLGGITSHAAIVARELKKPCITGTKIATKVFVNGDTVEVDAENGVVRKIN